MERTPDLTRQPATGTAGIDVEHQLQFTLVETLLQAVASGKPRDDVDALLDSLVDTSNIHFQGEELLMRMHSYDGLAQHVEEHRLLLEELAGMRAAFESGQDAALTSGATRVLAWLASHLRTHDLALSAFMAQGGLVGSGA